MADQDKDEVQAPDFLNMSDEEIANFDPSTMSAAPAPELTDKEAEEYGGDPGAVKETAEEAAATAAAAAALDDDDNKQDDKADNGEGAGDEGDQGKADTKDGVGSGAADASGTTDKTAVDKDGKPIDAKADAGKEKVENDSKTSKDENGAIDYEAEYKKLMSTFRANGRDMQAKSVEDARHLMQMGANYNKKMAGMKPSLKFLKMLESNGLLDEEQLGFLIDVHKRDPAAINKLIVDSKMDPLDLSADKASEYKPGNHSVDDTTMELDEVINELKDSDHYARTLDVVANQWDKASKAAVADSPQIMNVINGHMAVGIYDVVVAEIESERTFGRLKGLSDLEAYKQVGDAINARGGFNHLGLGSSQPKKETPAAKQVIEPPKPNKADEDKLKDKRKAAGSTKAAPNKGIPADFNPLQMSDADFAKFQI